MGKEFLFASWEGGGNIPPMLTLARRLLDRGHKVRVLGDDASADDMRAAGVEFRPWRTAPNRQDRDPESDPHKDWEIADPRELLPVLLNTQITGPALAHATDVLDELKARSADAVVASDLQLGPLVGAEAAGIPQAILSCNIPYLPRAGIPPFGPGLAPAENEQERQLQEQIGAGFAAVFDAGLAPLNAARTKLGLAPLQSLIEQLHRPALHLVASSEAFDFPTSEQPSNLHYIGPLLDPPAWVEPWQHDWSDPSRPLVLVAFSTTFQNQAPVLQSVVAALSQLPVNALVTAGPACDHLDLNRPAHVLVVRSASHDAILKQAALCITHCGHGTVMRALTAGVPILAMPMGRDQNDNAARLTWHGAGITIPLNSAPEVIAEAIRGLVQNSSYRDAAAALSAKILAEAEPCRAARLLEELAGGGLTVSCSTGLGAGAGSGRLLG